MTSTPAATAQPQNFTYKTAPARMAQRFNIPVTERQLRSWVWAGKVTHHKVGGRVFFTDEHLAELAESLTVRAVR